MLSNVATGNARYRNNFDTFAGGEVNVSFFAVIDRSHDAKSNTSTSPCAMKINQLLSLIAATLCWDASLAVEGTIGWDGHADSCKDENGEFLCYDPDKPGLLPGATTCDCWDADTGMCSLGNLSGTIVGGLKQLEEKEVAALATPAPAPAPESSSSFLRGGW